MKRTLLLFPTEAEGGKAVEEKQNDSNTIFSQLPDEELTVAEEVPSGAVDWNKESGKEVDFTGAKPKPEEKGVEDEEAETTKEKEAKVEGEVEQGKEVNVEVDKQTQVDDEPNKRQQQSVIDPITTRFPEVAPLYKKMSKEGREYLNARLNEIINKETEQAELTKALTDAQSGKPVIPANYYENPAAVVLTPEFQQVSVNLNLAQRITAHWDEQMGKILNGEEWLDLEDVVDPKTGRIIDVRVVADKPQKASGTAQKNVGNYLRQAERQLEQLGNYQQKLVSDFKQTVATRLGSIKKAENEFFPPEKFEKKDSPEAILVQNVAAGLRNIGITEANPAFTMLAKAGAVILQQREYIASITKKNEKEVRVAAAAKKAGPNGSISGQADGNAKSNENEDVMGDFNKVLIHKR